MTISNTSKRGSARRAAETAVDVVVGGTVLAADKAIEVIGNLVDSGKEAANAVESRVRETASDAADAAREAASGQDHRPYEDRTRDELYDLASERDIDGRSTMRKEELIGALREAQ